MTTLFDTLILMALIGGSGIFIHLHIDERFDKIEKLLKDKQKHDSSSTTTD